MENDLFYRNKICLIEENISYRECKTSFRRYLRIGNLLPMPNSNEHSYKIIVSMIFVQKPLTEKKIIF